VLKQFLLFAETFENRPLDNIVNVATVPLRSPFRYPGGKSWLVPRIRQWLASLRQRPAEFIEPFAGGAIAGLTVALEDLADRVTLVEVDEQVAAVWHTILSDDDGGKWLANEIMNFDLTLDAVKAALQETAVTTRQKAFQTILKNRVYRGGILAPGAAPLKHGENGKGIKSRWYPGTLKKRILDIVTVRDRITFIEGDGLAVIRLNAARADTVFFIDPPYTAAGKRAGTRLYTHHELDHEELFRLASEIAGDFLMTYDEADGIRDLAHRYGFDTELIAMKSTHHATMKELLIGRNLDWAR
jgi:DNA adenine methylase